MTTFGNPLRSVEEPMNTPDEETPLDSGDTATESATAVTDTATETEETSAAGSDSGEHTMSLGVEIEDAGPCRKHIRVTVPRSEIDHFYGEAVGEMLGTASVSGFRDGHVPRKLVEKRFRKELAAQVKQNVLMQSLEQISDRDDLDPINEPSLMSTPLKSRTRETSSTSSTLRSVPISVCRTTKA